MPLPNLTPEQREEALARAKAARNHRSEIKNQLKRGALTFKEVIELIDTDEVVAKTKVVEILQSMPKVGKVKAEEIMAEIGIAETRKLRGLGSRQRVALLEHFGFEV